MKNCFTLFFISLALVIQAQSITINQPGCFSNTVLSKNGTTAINGTTRNTYEGGSPVIRVIYTSYGGGRWEIQLDVFSWITCYYNTTASAPLAPAKGLGTWVSTGAVNGCNNLTTFSGTGTTITIPIELTHFDANTEGSKNLLTWRTASERDNKHFDIERSADGQNFTNIGQVKSLGNTAIGNAYQYTDTEPLAGIAYYRLKQTDFDGKFDYSPVVSVNRDKTQNKARVVTNPVTQILEIGVSKAENKMLTLVITDLMGRTVAQQTHLQNTQTLLTMDVSQLSAGIYLLKVVGKDVQETLKFVKN
jgi:hypothetical protein